MLRTLSAVLLVVIVATLHAAGQEPAPTAPPVFTAHADLVVLHVNVFDGRSDAVPQLPQSAFIVTDEGRPQTITFFSDADVPVAVGLVIDNSTSMISRHRLVVAGSNAFVASSHPEDELFSVIFNEHVRFGLQEPVAFTRSRAQLEASLRHFPAGGQTALYDAVFAALEHLQTAMLQKRVLIVLSDGDDNASRRSEADMLHRAGRSNALIYTISTADYGHQDGKPSVLKRLAARTGGVAYFPKSEKEIVSAFSDVAQNIRRGYSIGYVPNPPGEAGEYRRVKVTVHVPGRELTVRARDGYTAGGDADAAGSGGDAVTR
jgi:Ca-activated chloride channel family protein